MRFVNNEPEQIELRRSQNTLIVVGTGIILFGLWTAAKLMGSLFMLRKETVTLVREASDAPLDISDKALFVTLLVLTSVFTIVSVAFRVYIGRSAIAEGRGKRKSILYLILTCVLITGSVLSICSDVRVMLLLGDRPEQLGALTPNQSFTALIIEVTSLIMMIEMVISAIKVRKLSDKKALKGSIDAA